MSTVVRSEATKTLCTEFAECVGDAGVYADDIANCSASVDAMTPTVEGNRFIGRYVATIDVPYGCTEGDNSYARTRSLGKVALSGRFAGLDEVPPAIGAFVRTLPGARLGGISRPPR